MTKALLRSTFIGLSLVALTAGTASASPFIITANNNAAQLVANLVAGAPGINVVAGSATYTGAAAASGTFTGGTGVLPFDAGVVLTTGAASFVVGPNNSSGSGTDNGAAGDTAGLGANTFNASILEFDFIPTANSISFQYVFGSEEYNFYVGSQFNDVFAFLLNNSNIALIPGTASPVAINSVNCGTNASYYTGNNLENSGSAGGPVACGNANLDTQLDGLVGAKAGFSLFATGTVNVGVTNHIKLTIADRGDTALDSAVFLKAGSFVNAPPAPPPPSGTVPEPTTVVMLGSGLAFAAFRALRARK